MAAGFPGAIIKCRNRNKKSPGPQVWKPSGGIERDSKTGINKNYENRIKHPGPAGRGHWIR